MSTLTLHSIPHNTQREMEEQRFEDAATIEKRRRELFKFMAEQIRGGPTADEWCGQRTKSHPPAHTVEEWRPHILSLGFSPQAMMCKNLFLNEKKNNKTKGSIWLVVAHVDSQVPLAKLAKQLGFRILRFADEEMLKQTLGVRQGSVTPLALFNDRTEKKVNVIIDKVLLTTDGGAVEKRLLFHPLTNDHTTELTASEFKQFLDACGHTVREMDFSLL